jgi:hypothetical protein
MSEDRRGCRKSERATAPASRARQPSSYVLICARFRLAAIKPSKKLQSRNRGGCNITRYGFARVICYMFTYYQHRIYKRSPDRSSRAFRGKEPPLRPPPPPSVLSPPPAIRGSQRAWASNSGRAGGVSPLSRRSEPRTMAGRIPPEQHEIAEKRRG